MDTWYLWVVQHRNILVRLLVAFNCLLAVVWYLAFQTIVMEVGNPSWFYRSGATFGQIALVLYCITTIPGIMRRFGKFSKPVSVIMMMRRYIGIATFMFALLHVSISRFFWWMQGQMGLIPDEIFQLFGSATFVVLFLLFITSNDWSVKKLGPWWHTIHNLTYVAAWLLFAHVALQRLSVWSVLIGITSLAQLASHIYAKQKKVQSTV